MQQLTTTKDRSIVDLPIRLVFTSSLPSRSEQIRHGKNDKERKNIPLASGGKFTTRLISLLVANVSRAVGYIFMATPSLWTSVEPPVVNVLGDFWSTYPSSCRPLAGVMKTSGSTHGMRFEIVPEVVSLGSLGHTAVLAAANCTTEADSHDTLPTFK